MAYFRFRNLLLVSALVLALLLLGFIVLRYQPETSIKMLAKSLPEGVDLTLEKIDYSHVENGITRWRLQAEKVEHQTSSEQLGIRKPRLDFYDEQGAYLGSMSADAGEVGSDYKHIQVNGQVVLTAGSEYRLFAQELDYDSGRKAVTSDSAVRLVGQGMELTGTGLIINLADRHVTMTSDVTAIFKPETDR